MASCTNHPERESIEACAGCAKPFCGDCLVRFEKLALCASCKGRYLADVEAPAADAARPAVAGAPAPGARPARSAAAAPSSPLHWIGGLVALAFAAAFSFAIVA